MQALSEGLRRLAQAAGKVPLCRQVHELQAVVIGHRLVSTARLQHLWRRQALSINAGSAVNGQLWTL